MQKITSSVRRPPMVDQLATSAKITSQHNYIYELFDADIAIHDTSVLPTKEIRRLVQSAQQGDLLARNKMVMHCMRFIIKVARRYNPIYWPDLISEGVLGLDVALKTFKLRRNVHFLTYAKIRIKKTMDEFITRSSELVHIPANVVIGKRKVDRAISRIMAQKNMDFSVESVSKVAKMAARHVERYIHGDRDIDIVSLFRSRARDGGGYLYEILYIPDQPTSDAHLNLNEDVNYVVVEIRRLCNQLLKLNMTRKNWLHIFRLRYGLDGSMRIRKDVEVAYEIACSKENVRQTLNEVWKKLTERGWPRGRGEALLDNGVDALSQADELVGRRIIIGV